MLAEIAVERYGDDCRFGRSMLHTTRGHVNIYQAGPQSMLQFVVCDSEELVNVIIPTETLVSILNQLRKMRRESCSFQSYDDNRCADGNMF